MIDISKKYYCTLFDSNYFSFGTTLYDSIKALNEDFVLYVLCLDNDVSIKLQGNPQIETIQLLELESYFPELIIAKANRGSVPYLFTLSPFLPLYLIQKFNLPFIASLDADLCFYSSTDSIFNLLNKYSILITPHKFSSNLSHLNLNRFGKFNVSFQVFKNNQIGVQCLSKWASDCLEWCEDYLDEEKDRLADQKYLDKWESLFPGEVYSLVNPGCGVAVWNLNDHIFSFFDEKIQINGFPLIYYHFESFRFKNSWFFTNGFFQYQVDLSRNPLILHLYSSYFLSLKGRLNSISKVKNKLIRYESNRYSVIRTAINQKTFFIRFINKIYFFDISSFVLFSKKILPKW